MSAGPAIASMNIRNLTRRTPFRIAALFASLFGVAVALISTMLYFVITQELTKRLRLHADELRISIVEIQRSGSFEDVKRVVQGYASDAEPEDSVFLLVDQDSKYVAGNITSLPLFTGWRAIPSSELSLKRQWNASSSSTAVLGRWTAVPGGNLFVGSGNSDINDVQSILIEGLGLGAVLAMGLALMGGVVLGARAQQRIGAIDTALDAVAHGDLSRRVPRTASGEDDLDHVAQLINHTLDRMQSLFVSLKQVTADIAHDLKSPIGRVLQKLETVSERETTGPESDALVKEAREELRGTVQTFEALLRIAEIEGGARKARFANVDLRAILLDVIDILDAVASDQGHTLQARVAEAKPAVIWGDRELLVQAFINLVENAIRHCPRGSVIRVTLTEEDGRPVVAIADNGPGIPESEYENVFRRLVRLEKSRTTPGSGLGLSLVAAIIELHEAEIGLAGNNPGLVVTVRFAREGVNRNR